MTAIAHNTTISATIAMTVVVISTSVVTATITSTVGTVTISLAFPHTNFFVPLPKVAATAMPAAVTELVRVFALAVYFIALIRVSQGSFRFIFRVLFFFIL